MAKFFIERPVLANVLALVIMLLGGVAILALPIAQYPPITPPTVQVSATYPGANAETVVNNIALPIEQQVNGVENMLYMQSTSTNDGVYTLTVTFDIGTDLDFAQVLVQNRVSAAMASLPQAVQEQGVTTQKRSTAILQIITLTSPKGTYDSLFLSNYATINLLDELARLPGVGQVRIFGIGEYSMRIWLDPNQLYARSLTPNDVIDAIRAQNLDVAAGQVGAPPIPTGQDFQLTVNLSSRLDSVRQFEEIVVKAEPGDGGRITRIKDIGRAELGAQTYSQFSTLDNADSAGIAIFQLPDANALDVADAVEAAMAEAARKFPQDLTYSIPFDTTKFVTASINEVYLTLIEAGVLVLLVITIFLQNFRAMLVPATTVPVTIIGAFAAMALLGFSINLLTLFAIVLAIGIVVDDAIVVVEGASHHIERGLTPHDATIEAMRELFGPIIGITLVLMSVFLPAAFMPGITGQMYKQFALVIAATALISAINAATLKPTQCALWLRPVKHGRKNVFYRGFDRVFGAMERGYTWVIGHMVRASRTMVVVALGLVGVAGWGLATLPTSFIPTEDQGYLMAVVQLPDAASLQRTHQVLEQVTAVAQSIPDVEHVVAIGGVSAIDNNASLANAGIAYVILKDWDERTAENNLLQIYQELGGKLGQIQAAEIIVLPPPPIQGLGLAGGFQMEVELVDGSFDYTQLQRIADAIVDKADAQSTLQHVASPFRAGAPQLAADIDRVKTQALGLQVSDVLNAIQGYLGSSFVNQFTLFGQTFSVFIQADQRFRTTPENLRRYEVRNNQGDMVPIGTVADVRYTTGPSLVTLYNLHPAATINGAAAQGTSSGQALALMEEIAADTLPPGTDYQWTSISYQEKAVGDTVYFIFAMALLLVYFVLAGQYESWTLPAAVIFGVPLALLGTVGALKAVGAANNLYTQIGLVLLIALSAKNAILIVEFARDIRKTRGLGAMEAAVEAARVRFRPIVMTSLAFILGVLPLVLATGAGAAARKSIGITVLSGMLASTCLAVLFVPSFYVVLERLRERKKSKAVPATA
ncbi:MAG TPA: multidrug efflux RND transporter permease subunit [Kiloniellales bacterium]|nr:multidrug efflux RND transporter permease subunit [Kiloniellales bacterium]